MQSDAFSRCHPVVNFLFFMGAIGFGVVLMHPAYLAAAVFCSAVYYLLLKGKKGLPLLGVSLFLCAAISLLNPFFNTRGSYVLQYFFGRPYTLEALCYGLALGSITVIMLMWFGAYSQVLTSDKFTALFGNLIPALSLLLVMVLRMIPAFTRKAKQLVGVRRSIGKGGSEKDSLKNKARDGVVILSALTDWALEGSIVTSDSMRARGYGSGRRTQFRIYRMSTRDWVLLTVMLFLMTMVVLGGGSGASYTPHMVIDQVTWAFPVYCLFLLIPIALHIGEDIAWRVSKSRI